MDVEEIVSRYVALGEKEQIIVLASLAHNLTISARGSWSSDLPLAEVVAQLKTFHEVQHHVSSELDHLIRNDLQRYPDDVLVRILFEDAARGSCERQLTWAFDQAFSRSSAA